MTETRTEIFLQNFIHIFTKNVYIFTYKIDT